MPYLLGKPAPTLRPIGGGYILGDSASVPFNVDTPTTESLENIARYETQLMEAGIEPPKAKKVLGTVSRILDVLRTGEYAVGGLLAGKGPIMGIKEKISPSEVFGITPKETKSFWGLLKQPEFYGALAVDILLDPVTYLTFGFGGGAKLATSAGNKVLNKPGQKLLGKAVKQFGEDSARKMMATSILREGGEKWLAKGGLKFMGKEFLPRNVVQAPFKGIDWTIERVPFVGHSYLATKDLLGKAFKPMADINELPAKMGGDGRFEEIILKTQKGIRGETARELRYIGNLGKEARKAGIKDPGREITALVEFDKKSGNKVLDDIADWIAERHKEFGFAEQKRGIMGAGVEVDIPGYMRHFLTKEGREFLETKGKTIQQEFIGNVQKLRVTAPFAKERKLVGDIVNINNLYKEKYKIKLFEEDAFKAFSQRTFEHIKAVKMYDFFKNMVDERIAIRAPRVPQLVRRIGEPLTSIRKPLTETVIDGVKHIQTKVPQLEGFLVPEPIAKHLDMTYGLFINDEVAKGFLGLYDKLLRVWKGSVTGWFPAFHSRNFIGGAWNNWLGGIRNPIRYQQGDMIARGKAGTIVDRITKKVYTYDEIRRLVEDLGVSGAPGMMDVMKNTEEMMRIGKVAKVKSVAMFPRIAMETVEDRLRIPLFIDRLIKGDTPEAAAKWVFKFHFDYAPEGLTAFERNVMKRLIPFYTWTRGNVPLQIENVLKQPGKYTALAKVRENIERGSGSRAEEEKDYLPQWLQEMFIFRLPGESSEGLARYLQIDLPMEDLNKLPLTESGRREIIALLSPFIKYPIERIANRNLYFGSEIYDASQPQEYQTAKTIEAFKYLPEPLKRYLNYKETQIKNPRTGEFVTGYEMDALKLHAIRSMLAGRFYSTVATTTDSELSVWQRLSRILGGVPVRPIDMDEERFRRTKQQERLDRETIQYLKRRGIIGKKPLKSGYILGQ